MDPDKKIKIENKIVYTTQNILTENLTPEQRRYVIMQRFGNAYKNAVITYQQDPGIKMYLSHKLYHILKLNFLSRAKFIGQFN